MFDAVPMALSENRCRACENFHDLRLPYSSVCRDDIATSVNRITSNRARHLCVIDGEGTDAEPWVRARNVQGKRGLHWAPGPAHAVLGPAHAGPTLPTPPRRIAGQRRPSGRPQTPGRRRTPRRAPLSTLA